MIETALIAMLSLMGVSAVRDTVPLEQWNAVTMPLVLDGDTLSGPGATWIRDAASSCRFVLFGEQHDIEEIPRVVAGTYALLHDQGFEQLVLECGPWIGAELSARGVDEALKAAPFSLAFDSDSDLALLRTAEALSGDAEPRFIGVDQAITSVHPFERLVELAPSWRLRRECRGLLFKAAIKRHRALTIDHRHDIDRLRAAWSPESDSEADMMHDAISMSNAIYVAHVGGHVRESVLMREQLMMDQFDRALATSSGDAKFIFKLGGAHIMEGIGPNGVATLGQHVQEIADAVGSDALHISVQTHNGQGVRPPVEIFSANERVVLVDCHSIRDTWSPETLALLEPELQRVVAQYDALMYIRDAQWAPDTEIRAYERAFQVRLATSLSPMLLGLLGGLTGVLHPLRRLVSRLRGREWQGGRMLPWFAVVGGVVVLASVLGGQISAMLAQGADRAPLSTTIGLEVLIALVFLGLLGVAVFAVRLRRASMVLRVHLVGAAVCVGVAAWTMLQWNVGGMLGGGS